MSDGYYSSAKWNLLLCGNFGGNIKAKKYDMSSNERQQGPCVIMVLLFLGRNFKETSNP